MTSGKTTPGWARWRRIRNEPCVQIWLVLRPFVRVHSYVWEAAALGVKLSLCGFCLWWFFGQGMASSSHTFQSVKCQSSGLESLNHDLSRPHNAVESSKLQALQIEMLETGRNLIMGLAYFQTSVPSVANQPIQKYVSAHRCLQVGLKTRGIPKSSCDKKVSIQTNSVESYRCLWNKHSFHGSLCPAVQRQKLLCSPWCGALRASIPMCLLPRRSAFFRRR